MSFKAMAFATEQKITKTSPQSHLLLILASYANDDDECYPSIKTMVEKTRLNDKTVRNCLKDLIDLGLIKDTQKTTAFGCKIYKINLNVCEAIPPTKNGSTTNFGTTKNGITPLPNLVDPHPQIWEYPPTKNGITPLPNLVDNPIIEPIIEPVSVTANAPVENLVDKNSNQEIFKQTQSQIVNQDNKPSLQETIEFLKNSSVLPMSDDLVINEFELNFLISEVHAFWGNQLFRNQPFSKQQVLGKILVEIKKIGSVQDILNKLILPDLQNQISSQTQPVAYKTMSIAECLELKKQRKAKQTGA